jgi:hypothetical protein
MRGDAHAAFLAEGAPGHLSFGSLRLVAVAKLYPGEEVPMHRHEQVEDLLVLRSGTVEHRDSLGNRCILGPDSVVNLSTGTGVDHAETVIGDEPVDAVVIWIAADHPRGTPELHQRHVPIALRRGTFTPIAAGGSRASSTAVDVDADVTLSSVVLKGEESVPCAVARGRKGYFLCLDGSAVLEGLDEPLHVDPGDRILVDGEAEFRLRAQSACEVLFLDLPGAVDPWAA